MSKYLEKNWENSELSAHTICPTSLSWFSGAERSTKNATMILHPYTFYSHFNSARYKWAICGQKTGGKNEG